MKIVLASTSRSKNQILVTAMIKHSQIESDFDEKTDKSKNVYEHVKALSLGKAKSVMDKVSNSIIIGLDTVGFVNGHILEKPSSIDEARRHIQESSNNTTLVVTGLTLINQLTGEIINTYVETKVSFREISEKNIDFYLKNEPNYMYASGFILETVLSNFIDKIEGSYYNILGVPVETIYKYISQWGYELEDFE